MPNDGKMKKPKRLQHRLLIASEDKALKLFNHFLQPTIQDDDTMKI